MLFFMYVIGFAGLRMQHAHGSDAYPALGRGPNQNRVQVVHM
jgi:hypothetical protein